VAGEEKTALFWGLEIVLEISLDWLQDAIFVKNYFLKKIN
jgi:hypothetical protein